MVITIDGPAGSGKSTAARKLAARLEPAITNELVQRLRRQMRGNARRLEETREAIADPIPGAELRRYRHPLAMISALRVNKQS